jgi:hypothetical protein
MASTQVTTGGRQVAQRFVRGERLSNRSWPALGVDMQVQDQADRVVTNKEARDTWEAEQAARVCSCPQCRCAYRATLAFFGTLGTGHPASERISPDHLVWYTFDLSGGQLERT